MSFYISTFKKEKKIVKTILSFVFIILSTIFLFNLFINPYGNSYFKIEKINSKSITHLSKYDKLSMIKDTKIDFDAYAIGSSKISRFYAKNLDSKSPYKWISFPISASMASEHYYYMKFFSQFHPKKIIYGLDDNNLFGRYVLRGNTIIKEHYDYSLWDYFTFDTIVKAIDKIKYNNKEETSTNLNISDNPRYQYFNGWEDGTLTREKFDSLITTMKPLSSQNISEREIDYLIKIENEFGNKIIPIVSFYHPYYLLMNNKINYTKFLTESVKIFHVVWHINPKYMEETLNAKYYKDTSHTNERFANRVINSIFSNDDFYIQVNKDNYKEIINDIYKFSCEQDFSMYQYSRFVKCE